MTGSGTPGDPYIIYDINDLQAVKDDLTAYYELANDIDASVTVGWNGGLGFDPVGDWPATFVGNFDGKGYKITDLTINRPAERDVGLFGDAGEGGITAVIQNVGIYGGSIDGLADVGALCGGAYPDLIIRNCYATCPITGVAENIGGLVGLNYADISNSYATGSVSGQWSVGGFIGRKLSGNISQCFATGNVTNNGVGAYYGGFMGYSLWSSTQDCYARGDVTGPAGNNKYIGGFVGWNEAAQSTITRCYSTGLVVGTDNPWTGGFAGYGPSVTDSFWDIETSGQITNSGNAVGKTTAEMKTESTFTDVGWDFATIWDIFSHCNDGYPCLRDVTPLCSAPSAPFSINKAYALSREEL